MNVVALQDARVDPTGTSGIIKEFSRDLMRRWRKVETLTAEAIGTHDLLGITPSVTSIAMGSDKLAVFQRWIDNAMAQLVVGDGQWVEPYLRDSVAKAGERTAVLDYSPEQPRDREGRWVRVGEAGEKGIRKLASGHALPSHIPRIPPAWSDVEVNLSKNADLLVVGRDAKGRQQAIYSQRFASQQAASKFARIEALQKRFDAVVRQNEGMRKAVDDKVAAAADATKLIIETGLRPGSDRDTQGAVKAYGATTLEGRHVVLGKDHEVRLQFVGKKGVHLDIPVDDHGTRSMLLARKINAGSKGRLFNISADELLAHVHTLNGGSFKTKDFRTAVANNLAMSEIKKTPLPNSVKEYKTSVRNVAKAVAAKLGNTPTIALQSYINPSVFARWRMHAHV